VGQYGGFNPCHVLRYDWGLWEQLQKMAQLTPSVSIQFQSFATSLRLGLTLTRLSDMLLRLRYDWGLWEQLEKMSRIAAAAEREFAEVNVRKLIQRRMATVGLTQ